MTQNATQAKKSRSFTVGVSFQLSSYYSLDVAFTTALTSYQKGGKFNYGWQSIARFKSFVQIND